MCTGVWGKRSGRGRPFVTKCAGKLRHIDGNFLPLSRGGGETGSLVILLLAERAASEGPRRGRGRVLARPGLGG